MPTQKNFHADLDVSSHFVSEYVAAREDEPFTLDQVMGRHIRNVLKMTGGKVEGPGGAAELLGDAEAARGGKNNPSGRRGKRLTKA